MAAAVATPTTFTFDEPPYPWRQLPRNLDVFNWEQLAAWFDTKYDRRTSDFPFMESFLPTLGIVILYALFAVVGRKVMEDQPAMKLKGPMIAYNCFVIVLNAYLFVGFIQESLKLGYGWVCNRVDYGPDGERLANLVYIYYLSKLLDFSDTVFMVLRKKFDQLSFLHVYHHGMMFFIWWSAVRWAAGGDGITGPVLNTFVHFVMYSYYLGTCFGYHFPGKQYLTQLQMTQLFLLLLHSVWSISLDCQYPHWTLYCQVAFLVTLLILFYNFYMKSYKTKPKPAAGGGERAIRKHD